MWADVALVLVFVLIGGFFAAAEMALVSLRPGQVSRLAAGGRRDRRVARLLGDPNRFLSAVQIGVTLAGMFSSAVGAVALAGPLAGALGAVGLTGGLADTAALVIVTVLVAYVSLVLGELAPKRLALQRSEAISRVAAGPLETLARISRPVIWLLGRSTNAVVRLLGGDPASDRDEVTEAELRDIVATSSDLTADERRLISGVLDAGDRPLREVMVPRLDVAALDVRLTVAEATTRTADRPWSRYPVIDGSLDDVVGFVHLRDLLAAQATETGGDTPLGDLVRPVTRLPDSGRVMPALAQLRRSGSHLAVVVDEYGGSAGIVTLEDLIEELVGDITDEFDRLHGRDPGTDHHDHDHDHDHPDQDRRDHVSPPAPRLPVPDVDAQLRLGEFAEHTGVTLPDGPYATAAGWLVAALGRIPDVGDAAECTLDGSLDPDGEPARRVRLTVVRMRGRRVAGLRVEEVPEPGTSEQGASEPERVAAGHDDAG